MSLGWVRYVTRRSGLMLLTLFLVCVAVFGITESMPADSAQYLLGQNSTDEALAALRARLGLDQPAHIRFIKWIGNAIQGDLGYSGYLNSDITPVLLLRLRNSLVLGVFGFFLCVPLAILLGLLAGVYAGGLIDGFLSLTSLIGLSLPEFVSAVFLTILFSNWLGWLPPSSLMQATASPWAEPQRLVLPALTATLAILAYILRMTRSSVKTVMQRPYVRTARLKGLPWRTVVFTHALRNALLPAITVIFNSLSWLFGGLVVVETFYAYPGIARLLLAAVEKNDVQLLQATTLVIATMVLLANFLADVTYALLDPRVRYK